MEDNQTTANNPARPPRAELPAVHPYIARDIPWLLEMQAERCADDVFMLWESPDGDQQTWTYRDHLDAVRRFAGGLAARGVNAGDRVLLHMGNRPEFLTAWFGCLWHGAVAVSTNIHSGMGELRYFAEHAGCRVAVTDEELVGAVQDCEATFEWIASTGLERAGTVPFSGLLEAQPAPRRDADPALFAAMMYTSGTTSRPKAVVFTHANLLWAAQISASHLGVQRSDRAFVYLPLFHLNALGYTMLPSLWVGSSMLLHAKFSAQRWWASAVRHKCTWTFAAPFVPKGAGDPPKEGHSFRFWGYQWGSDGYIDDVLGIPCLGVYGMTETISQPIFSDFTKPCARHAIGRAAPEYRLRLVGESGEDVPPGEPGRLLVEGVRGISLFWGYLNDEEATAASFVDGWFDTGDMIAQLPDGSLRFTDRQKDMMKVGGENVASTEVEAVIMVVEGVREVAVVGGPHEFLDEVPVAFVVTDREPESVSADIDAVCARELAKFKRPREVRFIEALPRLTIGKVDRKVLRAQLRQEAEDQRTGSGA